jgi:hypothetical protein
MSADPRFTGRVIRLTATSAVALGLIFLLWAVTTPVTTPGIAIIGVGLGAGWVLMPSLLALSLWRPVIRYGLVAPATMVSLALVAISLWGQPKTPVAEAGWLLISGGVLLGGALGAWFWFRWLPVPRSLHDPFAPGRWVLIGVHVGMIIVGIGLVGLSALS